MKTTSIAVITVTLLVGGSLAFSQAEDPKPDLAKKVEVLETDLIATRARAETVVKELEDTKATLAKVVHYLDAQAKNAAAMADVLDESEAAGFTAGINPRSRELLLAGWREQLVTLQTEVPAMPVAPPKAGEGKAGERKQ